jgi:hypothetical protein
VANPTDGFDYDTDDSGTLEHLVSLSVIRRRSAELLPPTSFEAGSNGKGPPRRGAGSTVVDSGVKRFLVLGTLAGVAVAGGGPVIAQEATVAVGYTKMPGRLGGLFSDHGPSLRLGADLFGGSAVRFGAELGLDRLNQDRREFTQTCFLPSGGTGTCHFETLSRDLAISVSALLRLEVPTGTIRPFGVVGLGFLHVREHSRSIVTDSAGNHLTNFEFEGSSADDALQGHLGSGLAIHPRGWRIGIVVEGRLSYLIYGYSGGLVSGWMRSALAGVRLRI